MLCVHYTLQTLLTAFTTAPLRPTMLCLQYAPHRVTCHYHFGSLEDRSVLSLLHDSVLGPSPCNMQYTERLATTTLRVLLRCTLSMESAIRALLFSLFLIFFRLFLPLHLLYSKIQSLLYSHSNNFFFHLTSFYRHGSYCSTESFSTYYSIQSFTHFLSPKIVIQSSG